MCYKFEITVTGISGNSATIGFSYVQLLAFKLSNSFNYAE